MRIAGALDLAAVEHHIVNTATQAREHSSRRGGARRGQRLGHLVAARRGRDGSDAQRRAPHLRNGGVRLPEQLLGGVPLDLRSNIYSLGCLMYEWETGRKPLSGTWHEIRRRRSEASPRKSRAGFRKTSFGAEDVITRCLQRERYDRFSDLEGVRQRLHDGRGPARHHGGAVRPEDALSGVGARGPACFARVAGARSSRGAGLKGARRSTRGAARDLDEAKRSRGSRRLEGRRRSSRASSCPRSCGELLLMTRCNRRRFFTTPRAVCSSSAARGRP